MCLDEKINDLELNEEFNFKSLPKRRVNIIKRNKKEKKSLNFFYLSKFETRRSSKTKKYYKNKSNRMFRKNNNEYIGVGNYHKKEFELWYALY